MKVWAFNAAKDQDAQDLLAQSLKNGKSRFGWSQEDNHNLLIPNNWTEWHQGQRFLLEINPGDWIVHINTPTYGHCIAAKVTGGYGFDEGLKCSWGFDFRHFIPVDVASVRCFNRNDKIVHPFLSQRLKLQRRWWRIRAEEEFHGLLQELDKESPASQRTRQTSLALLSNEIKPYLANITKSIHRTHPNYDMEGLVAEVLKKVPGVLDVEWQGGSGDRGADIIVTYESGLPIPALRQEETLVVQVKSYDGEHWETKAVQDIKRAFDHYPEASAGLIVSTATTSTPALDTALENLISESNKPVALLIGNDVAAFLLRFGTNLLA